MKFKTAITLALSVATFPLIVLADPPSAPPKPAAGIAEHANVARGDEITPQQQRAVERGLAWLAEHQSPDGSFGGPGMGKDPGITSLGALALMENGNLPNRGKYGENVARALRFVLNSCGESGLISDGNNQSPMYGHGFATLFLGEVYGMSGEDGGRDSGKDELENKLKNAIKLIEDTQGNQPGIEGGWRYQPAPVDADISVTICQVMALRAARDAGIYVNPATVEKAIKYVQSCQNPDGGFSYVARFGGGTPSGFGRSAAGCASLYYADHQGVELERGLKYLQQYTPGKGHGGNDPMDQEGNFFYGNYYATQAMFLAGGKYWADWYPGVRDQIIARQNSNGGWSGEYTDDYCTAMALIILQMPNRYLPVFNGKGPGD